MRPLDGVMAAKDLTHPPKGPGLQWRNRPGLSPASMHRHPRLAKHPENGTLSEIPYGLASVEPGGQRPAGFEHVAFGA
jgi:hypothetical protein